MGTTSTGTSQNSTTTATATPQEKEMEQLQLDQYKTVQPAQTQLMQQGYSMASNLMNSFSPGSQNWNSMTQGINQNQQNSMVQSGLQQLMPQFQSSGILDSGTAQTGALKASSDLYNQNAQFNIGTMQNALNMALGGQAQVQGSTSSLTGQLGQELSGLRTTNSSSSMTQTSNPFLTSFYGASGKTSGGGFFGMGG